MFYLKVFTFIVLSYITSSGISGLILTMTPTNSSYCTSQNLTLTCTITEYHGNESNPARDLIFMYNNQPVHAEHVFVMTNFTAEYIISNKIPTTPYLPVECCFRTCKDTSRLDSVLIKYYVQPELVKNFRCVVQGVSFGPVHCSWEYDVNYKNSYRYPDITFIWRNSSGNEWNKRKLHSPSNRSFDLDSQDVNYLSAEVGVNISSSVCGSSSFTSKFYDVKTVQLPVISGLSGYATTSRCVKLLWNPTTFDIINKQYMVNCTNNWNIPKTFLFDSINQTEKELCGLIPATIYDCSVKVRVFSPNSVLYNESIWNRVQSTRVRTFDDVPERSPQITWGSYTWETQICDDTRTPNYVRIYWKPLAERYYNGKLNGTMLTYNKGNSLKSVLVSHNMSSNARLELDCQRTHKVNIQAVNNIGLSQSPSTLWVYPPQKDIPRLIVEENSSINGASNLNTKYLFMEWNHTESTLVNNYTVFRALRNGQTCDPSLLSHVEWKTVPGRDNNTTLTVSDRAYCYGISVQTDNASSGLKWTDCVYVRNEAPRPPDDVNAAGGISDNTLIVRWNVIPCSAGQPYISWYETGYCPVDSERQCKGTLKILSCPGKLSAISLDQLDAHIEYKIKVRAVTRLYLHGNWSVAVYANTSISSVSASSSKGGLAVGQITFIILGSISLPCLIPILVIALKKYRKRMNMVNKVDDIPVFPDSSVYKTKDIPTVCCSQLRNNDINAIKTIGRYNEDTDSVKASGSSGEHIEQYDETEKVHITDGYMKIHLKSLESNQNSHENDCRIIDKEPANIMKVNIVVKSISKETNELWTEKENSKNVFDDTGEKRSIEIPENTHCVLPGSSKQSFDVTEHSDNKLSYIYIQQEESGDISDSPKTIKQTNDESLHPEKIKLSQGYIEWRPLIDTPESSVSIKQTDDALRQSDNTLAQEIKGWRRSGDTPERSCYTSESSESINQSTCTLQHPGNKLPQETNEWRKSDGISERSDSIKRSNRVSQPAVNQDYVKWRSSGDNSDWLELLKLSNRVSQHSDNQVKQGYIQCPELIELPNNALQQPDNTLIQDYIEWRNPDDIPQRSDDQIPEHENITSINTLSDSGPFFDNSLMVPDNSLMVPEILKTTTCDVSKHNNLPKLANDGYVTDTSAVCLHSVHLDGK